MKYTEKNYNIQNLCALLKEDASRIIFESEDFYHSQIKNAAEITAHKKIILLSGPSASGKTTTANKICEELSHLGIRSAVVSLDDFYLNRDDLPVIDGKRNAEVVEALNIALIHKTMADILDDGNAVLPRYDFNSGMRTDNAAALDIGENGTVIFEGIHALNPIITSGLDTERIFKVYISPHSSFTDGEFTFSKREMRFIRRMIRDSWSRGTSPGGTMAMWKNVVNGEETLIKPFAPSADFHINTTHAYEPFIMRNSAIKLLRTVPESDPNYDRAQRYIVKMTHFDILDQSLLPENSLLREFLNPDCL